MAITSEFSVGKIVNVHGLLGEVKLVLWIDVSCEFEDFSYVYIKDGENKKKLFIESVKYQKNNAIVKFKGINSIDDAQKLKNKIISLTRDELGEPPEGRYYIEDLLGIKVYTYEGEYLGGISDVYNAGSCDIYVISKDGKKDLLLPVTPELNCKMDIVGCIATVHLSEGLRNL